MYILLSFPLSLSWFRFSVHFLRWLKVTPNWFSASNLSYLHSFPHISFRLIFLKHCPHHVITHEKACHGSPLLQWSYNLSSNLENIWEWKRHDQWWLPGNRWEPGIVGMENCGHSTHCHKPPRICPSLFSIQNLYILFNLTELLYSCLLTSFFISELWMVSTKF